MYIVTGLRVEVKKNINKFTKSYMCMYVMRGIDIQYQS